MSYSLVNVYRVSQERSASIFRAEEKSNLINTDLSLLLYLEGGDRIFCEM
jgi:hypothetical protein